MKIVVSPGIDNISLECEPTDTIAHLKAKILPIRGIQPHEQMLVLDRKQLDNNFSENMTLADVGVQEGSVLYLEVRLKSGFAIKIEKLSENWRRPEIGYLYYADVFKSGWREEHGKVLLNLLLKRCQDGAIFEGNILEDVWLWIQNGLKNLTKCSFQIDFLEERLRDYKQLYSLLVETRSPIFHWDRPNKTIRLKSDLWRKYHPEILLLTNAYISYFDTLEGVCLLLDTRRSSEQQVSETSTNINNERLVHQHRDLPSKMKIFVKTLTGKVFSLECEPTYTIDHIKAKVYAMVGIPPMQQSFIFEGRHYGWEGYFSETITLDDIGIEEGSVIFLILRLSGSGGGEYVILR